MKGEGWGSGAGVAAAQLPGDAPARPVGAEPLDRRRRPGPHGRKVVVEAQQGVDVKASECGLVGGAVGVPDWALGPGPATRADRNIEPEIYQSSLIRICGHGGH